MPLFFCSFALNTSRRSTNRKKCGDRGAAVFMAYLDITKRAMNSWRLSCKYCPLGVSKISRGYFFYGLKGKESCPSNLL